MAQIIFYSLFALVTLNGGRFDNDGYDILLLGCCCARQANQQKEN
jgi:hypothetical protein